MSGFRCEAPSAGAVFRIAWPLTLKAIMLHGVVVIDAYLVSPLGETALAALGLASAVAGLVLGALLAFANAMQIRTAQAVGTGEMTFIRSAFVSGLVTSGIAVSIGLVLVWSFGRDLLAAVAHDPSIAGEAWRYLSVFSIVLVIEALGQPLSSYFNGSGETRTPFHSYLLAVPVNVAASVVLIHGHLGLPAFGVAGAAMGSAVAALVQVGYLGFCISRRMADFRRARGWQGGTFSRALWRHLAFALPIAATFVSATAATHVCSMIYARLSVNEFAALTLITPWVMVVGTVGMCWAQATGIIVAQLLGQKASSDILDRFLGTAWKAAFVAATLVSAIYAGVCLASPWIYPTLHPETRATLLQFLPILVFLPFPKQSNAICGNTLRAGGETIYVMNIFVWAQWLFRVPATALLVLYFHLPAAWVFSLILIEEVIKFPAFHLRLFKGRWKKGIDPQ
ncbi:MATE family efflux transporter [Amaricoccus macauensis]|uniref:MATE family efflux transporter n=1 Tax=Amaricoccus macauensis TaxID=57001 RepID=UPI003C7D0C6D